MFLCETDIYDALVSFERGSDATDPGAEQEDEEQLIEYGNHYPSEEDRRSAARLESQLECI